MLKTMTKRFVFDTCFMIYLSQPDAVIAAEARQALETDEAEHFVSAISVWEIGLLVAKGRLNLTRSPNDWFGNVVDEKGIAVLAASPSILVASSFLPSPLHADPADRILVATAREHDLTLITRDRAILAYGAAGHVKVLAC